MFKYQNRFIWVLYNIPAEIFPIYVTFNLSHVEIFMKVKIEIKFLNYSNVNVEKIVSIKNGPNNSTIQTTATDFIEGSRIGVIHKIKFPKNIIWAANICICRSFSQTNV